MPRKSRERRSEADLETVRSQASAIRIRIAHVGAAHAEDHADEALDVTGVIADCDGAGVPAWAQGFSLEELRNPLRSCVSPLSSLWAGVTVTMIVMAPAVSCRKVKLVCFQSNARPWTMVLTIGH